MHSLSEKCTSLGFTSLFRGCICGCRSPNELESNSLYSKITYLFYQCVILFLYKLYELNNGNLVSTGVYASSLCEYPVMSTFISRDAIGVSLTIMCISYFFFRAVKEELGNDVMGHEGRQWTVYE